MTETRRQKNTIDIFTLTKPPNTRTITSFRNVTTWNERVGVLYEFLRNPGNPPTAAANPAIA